MATLRRMRAEHDRGHFYKYGSAKAAWRALRTGTLRWCSPMRFNDPFDMQLPVSPGFDFAALSEPFVKTLLSLVFGEGPLRFAHATPMATAVGRLRALRRDVPEAALRAMIIEASGAALGEAGASLAALNDAWRERLRRLRVLCLTTAHNEPLMWSHYATKHTGAMLKLRCVDEPPMRSAWCDATAVRYVEHPPHACRPQELVDHVLGLADLGERGVYRCFDCCKSRSWSYEREWRVIAEAQTAGPYDDVPFDPSELEAVVLGCRMKPAAREAIIAAVRRDWPDIELREARRDAGRFMLALHTLRRGADKDEKDEPLESERQEAVSSSCP